MELSIQNLRGQCARLLREGIYPAGDYRVRWDGSDERGQRLASAVYIVRLVAGGEAHSKRLVLVK
jgi:hypothetical protein